MGRKVARNERQRVKGSLDPSALLRDEAVQSADKRMYEVVEVAEKDGMRLFKRGKGYQKRGVA